VHHTLMHHTHHTSGQCGGLLDTAARDVGEGGGGSKGAHQQNTPHHTPRSTTTHTTLNTTIPKGAGLAGEGDCRGLGAGNAGHTSYIIHHAPYTMHHIPYTMHHAPNTLNHTLVHYTALHCTTLHYTALHCTTLHYTALHCTTLHCTSSVQGQELDQIRFLVSGTVLYCTALYSTALYSTLHCTLLHCAVLYCTHTPSNTPSKVYFDDCGQCLRRGRGRQARNSRQSTPTACLYSRTICTALYFLQAESL
jgi:hypothetical protein